MAQIHRLWCPFPWETSAQVDLDTESSHIITSVLRLRAGADVTLLDGQGKIAQATVEHVHPKSSVVRVGHITHHPRPQVPLYLVQGALKSDKVSWLIQKATELGVSGIYFFQAKHSVAVLKEGQHDRLNKIAVEALRQSGNPYLPTLRFFSSLAQVLQESPLPNTLKLWLNEGEKHVGVAEAQIPLGDWEQALAVIGPEGGLAQEEQELLKRNDFCSIRMASYILRSETAAVAMAAAWPWMLAARRPA